MYIAGSNKYGELNYNETGVEYRNFVKFADKISQVSANYSRTAFITKSNKLFYFGWKTGLYDNVAPTLISNNVIDVSLTNTNIYYITNKKVYEFVPKTNITTQLMLQEEPVSLATGTGHLVVLTKNGNVYTYGLNNQGQLCSNNTINKTILTNVSYYGCNTISCGGMYKSIAANGNNTYLITKSGELKFCGVNTSGQGGLNSTSPTIVKVPTAVPNATGVNKVAATTSGVFILRNDGLIDLIGWHNYIDNSNSPRNRSLAIYTMSILSQIDNVSAGSDNSFFKDKYGTIYAWGGNIYGKLGDGTNVERHYPVIITLPERDKAKHCTMDVPCNNDKDYK